MMMNSPGSSLPPAQLTDDALRLCASLLQVASDPAGTKARLDELSAATAALRAEIDGHAAAKTQAETATAALADVEQRAKDLAAREDALIAAQTRLNVSAGAIADRDEQVKLREQASDRRAADLGKREGELTQKLARYREALA